VGQLSQPTDLTNQPHNTTVQRASHLKQSVAAHSTKPSYQLCRPTNHATGALAAPAAGQTQQPVHTNQTTNRQTANQTSQPKTKPVNQPIQVKHKQPKYWQPFLVERCLACRSGAGIVGRRLGCIAGWLGLLDCRTAVGCGLGGYLVALLDGWVGCLAGSWFVIGCVVTWLQSWPHATRMVTWLVALPDLGWLLLGWLLGWCTWLDG